MKDELTKAVPCISNGQLKWAALYMTGAGRPYSYIRDTEGQVVPYNTKQQALSDAAKYAKER